MRFEELHNIIKGKSQINEAHLSDLITLSTRYPYSASLHAMILLGLYKTQDLRFASELQRRSLYIPDLAKLFLLLKGDDKASLQSRTAEGESAIRGTFDIIDTFLAEHPDDSSSDIEHLISSQTGEEKPTVTDDYLSWVEDNTSPPPSSSAQEDTMTLISDFLNKGTQAERLSPREEEKPSTAATNNTITTSPPEEELLTETLARIYIKQGKYDNALRIIKSLNLNNPKKSSYFAEQIDFLEKLILNS